ncbi:efflux RND transporter permease subunit [Halochromatium glycolicum]|uniref:Acriflavin resistance protein n=1 Tax=Halochromatium glycolicum TaxID=85075 RepID=A0AAJ0U372_9GAMM|nr:efflux RND transporter permease subunit [Halochromatium glycolicum]MBK1704454.1 acriflavin resistance protein [Halochromatium glycolicum]
MFRFAIERPVILTVGILILTLFGILAIFNLPVQMIPDLDARVVTVETRWPGAAPQDVEKELVVEQEKYLGRIPGLERMVATASTGRATIELEFPFSISLEEALLNVNNALSQVPTYPENVDQPSIRAEAFSSNAFMFFRLMPETGQFTEDEIVALRDWVEEYVLTPMERVPGVSSVDLRGGAPRQMQVFVDPVRLAEREITLSQVRAAIRARNQDVSGGDLDSGKRRYLLRTIGRFDGPEALERLVIAERDGAYVRLEDVGHAELGYAEVRSFAYSEGRPILSFAVNRQIGSNVIAIKEAMLATVDDLNQRLLNPRGLKLVRTADDVVYVTDAIAVVERNLAIGAVLAVLVLFLFLRSVPATLIGAVGIPLCTIAAFLGILITGRTINVISLAGVAFAIGMTLDNNIVVLENIVRHLAKGKDRMTAALQGVREVWPAVLASTLTTVAVFLPVIFVEEEAGQLYSDIAVAISASILMSMLIAITLVPAASGRFLRLPRADRSEGRPEGRPEDRPDGRPDDRFDDYPDDHSDSRHGDRPTRWLDRAGGAFARAVLAAVRWISVGWVRPVAVIALVLAIAGAIIAWLTPAAEYLPEGEEAKVFTLMFAPPGYNIDMMREAFQRVDADFYPAVGQDRSAFAAGETAVPPLNFTIGFASERLVFVVREATHRRDTEALMDVAREKTRELPGLRSFSSRGSIFSSNFGGTRSINIEISGPDLPTLFEAARQVKAKARGLFDAPRLKSEPSSLVLGQPMLEIRPDWERAAELGLTPGDLGYAIWAFSDGAFVDEVFVGDDEIDLFLYSTEGTIERPQDLERLLLSTPAGGVVPLSAVARLAETVNTETIRRVDADRTVTLSIIPPRAVPLEEGVRLVREQIIAGMPANGELPPEIALTLSGASDRLEATRDALAGFFAVALLIAYLLMVAVFSHWGWPLLIMTSVPIGVSGGIAGLALLNLIGGQLDQIGLYPIQQPFDMITMLGFLVLIGTVVNNPILITERAVSNVRDAGMRVIDAITDAVRVRLRPIMMSMVTTVAGLSPLVLNPGAGTELYRGLGAIVLFGLLFSTLVTLTFMPALLALTLRFARPAAAAARARPAVEA